MIEPSPEAAAWAAAESPQTFDVFLSHNGKDKAAVTRLVEKLRRHGFKLWIRATAGRTVANQRQRHHSLAVDPSGRLLMAAVSFGGIPPAGVLTALDLTQRGQQVGNQGPPSDGYRAVGFAPGGQELVTVGPTTGWLAWDAGVNAGIERACHLAGRDLTPAEWASYVGPEPYQPVCGTAR